MAKGLYIVQPALSAEEWAEGRTEEGITFLDVAGEVGYSRFPGPWLMVERRHAMAATCLHGQPFGFTREDVERLRIFTSTLMSKQEAPGTGGSSIARGLDSLADRIEALLPPEE